MLLLDRATPHFGGFMVPRAIQEQPIPLAIQSLADIALKSSVDFSPTGNKFHDGGGNASNSNPPFAYIPLKTQQMKRKAKTLIGTVSAKG
ncbi:MAG: hypothetical protein ACRD4K_00810 [Candidatus Acidiferrales bacterium]